MEESLLLKKIALLFHLAGFGLIATLLFAGPLLERKFQKAETLDTKVALQRSIRSVGLLSPLAVLLLIITGIATMYYNNIGLFTSGWLTAKIIFFAIAIVNGTMIGASGNRRGKLLAELARGEKVPNALTEMQAHNRRHSIFYVTQSILILLILTLSVFRPD